MAALSRPKPDDPRIAERFELYVGGLELANAFGELTDAEQAAPRFDADQAKQALYGETYPIDEDFLAALEHGLPDCAGIALGFDRLVMLATGADDIDDVLWAPVIGNDGCALSVLALPPQGGVRRSGEADDPAPRLRSVSGGGGALAEETSIQSWADIGADRARATFSQLKLSRMPPLPEMDLAEDYEIEGRAGPRRVRILRPKGAGTGPLPVALYFHGGGYVMGGIDESEDEARRIAANTPALVISASYRLGPDHPFPAAIDDAYDALLWTAHHAAISAATRAG